MVFCIPSNPAFLSMAAAALSLSSSLSPLDPTTGTAAGQQPQPQPQPPQQHQHSFRVAGLYRYAVKGLSADALTSVTFDHAGDTFPDDRRFALRFQEKPFKPKEWMHKENFLCAFTAPQLLSQLETSYEIRYCSSPNSDQIASSQQQQKQKHKRILTIRDRKSKELLLFETNLATDQGRQRLSQFLTEYSGREVECVTNCPGDSKSHDFQFGNTSSGVKLNKGDTRTIHIVNQNTVEQARNRFGLDVLHATRFRPNLVLEGPEPWVEFEWVKQGSILMPARDSTDGGNDNDKSNNYNACNNNNSKNNLRIRALQRTVRCDGVSVDPLDPATVLDIPKLLTQHFPEHGPYLGIYAVVDQPGSLAVGDELVIV